ncbi:hypothetical protein NFI96_008111 [Prochilodus magdalenae]|nr:hypothetical protein NFI96_008111 [Prochilodus magdalenae]
MRLTLPSLSTNHPNRLSGVSAYTLRRLAAPWTKPCIRTSTACGLPAHVGQQASCSLWGALILNSSGRSYSVSTGTKSRARWKNRKRRACHLLSQPSNWTVAGTLAGGAVLLPARGGCSYSSGGRLPGLLLTLRSRFSYFVQQMYCSILFLTSLCVDAT